MFGLRHQFVEHVGAFRLSEDWSHYRYIRQVFSTRQPLILLTSDPAANRVNTGNES